MKVAYAKILSDKSNIKEAIALLKSSAYNTPIPDFTRNNLVYVENPASYG